MRLWSQALLLPVLTATHPPSGVDVPPWTVETSPIPGAPGAADGEPLELGAAEVVIGGVDEVWSMSDFDAEELAFAEAVDAVELGPCDCSFGNPDVEDVELLSAGVPGSVLSIPRLGEPVRPDFALRGIVSNRVERLIDRQMLDGIADGSLSPRLPRWRPRLLAMLIGGGPLDFDATFGLLLGTFPGSDMDERMESLHRWAEAQDPLHAADVYRAETRHWLRTGAHERAIDAANRMEIARPDYRVRSCRLRAVALASSGRLAQARASLVAAHRENPPLEEWAELLYLGAWIDLQDGRESEARRELEVLLSRVPCGPVADRARRVLSTLVREADE